MSEKVEPIVCTRCLDDGFLKTARIVTVEEFQRNADGGIIAQPAVGEAVITYRYCTCATGKWMRRMEA